jgi:site-specific DNA-methyltransferase (adenine-specific)
MRYLCRLVTPSGGKILDPFAGSGTTGQAPIEEGFVPTLVEREAEYAAEIKNRLRTLLSEPPPLINLTHRNRT